MNMSAMHAAVRKVLQHHGLTKFGDGVLEADLIAAVLGALEASRKAEAAHNERKRYDHT